MRPTPRILRRLAVPAAAGLAALAMATAGASPAAADKRPDRSGQSHSRSVAWTGEGGSATGSTIGSGDCDVNGDQHADVVTGAWMWDKAPANNTGAAYVILGADRPGGGRLADPNSASAVRIDGPDAGNGFVGISVACVGDTNGDGYDDIAIGDYVHQRVYVVFGARDFTPVDLGAMGGRGRIIQAPQGAGNFGYSVSPAGDLDSDGFADVAVGEVAADTRGRTNNGRVWLVGGGRGTATVAVGEGEHVLGTIDGAHDQARLSAVAPAGDVNGDRVPDLILGAYVDTPFGSKPTAVGSAAVVFGERHRRGTGFGVVDLANLGARGFSITGPQRGGDRLGISVTTLGDLDRDGRADLAVGADGASGGAGGVAVVHGSASTSTVRVDPDATTTVYTCAADAASCSAHDRQVRGWWIQGASSGDETGFSVAGIGDVNGDHVPDLLTGAYGADPVVDGATLRGAGSAFVVYGHRGNDGVDLGKLTSRQGYRIDGTAAGQRFGRAVAAVGDADRNGHADFTIGGDAVGSGGDGSGTVSVQLAGRTKSHGSTTGLPSQTPRASWPQTVPVGRGVPESAAYAEHNWKPTQYDSCPVSLHNKYSMVGSDGKRYPTWHPSVVIDPATRRPCTFGHEHGDDPRSSHIYRWVSNFLSNPASRAKGIPFGMVGEASMEHSGGTGMRHEDNVGHKIFVANDVPVLRADTREPISARVHGRTVPMTCDYLIKLHQGTYSVDALSNNAHELIYAMSCTDGTRVILSTLSRFGDPNEYNRSCDPATVVRTSGSTLPAGDGGARQVPDAACIDRHVLTTGSQRSDNWALYEVWKSVNRITTADGKVLASYEPDFGVRNASRYGDTANAGAALPTLGARWLTDPADGGTANGFPWSGISEGASRDQFSPASPFDGAQRDDELSGTVVDNAHGRTTWYTDPYGRDAGPRPFKGSVRQYVSRTDTTGYPAIERTKRDLSRDYGQQGGVHAPN